MPVDIENDTNSGAPGALLETLVSLPASAINYFLRLHQFTRSEFLVGRDLDDDLTLDQLCKLSLIDLLPPIREARVESFEDDCLVVKINYLSPAEYFAAERLVQSLL